MIKKILLLNFVILSFIVLIDYTGNKLIYLIFSLTSISYLFYMFRSKSIFFDQFIGLFLFLGLWINFSIKIKLKNLFPNGFGDFKYWFSDGVGSFDFSSNSINEALILCILSLIAISLASFVREKFFIYKNNYITNYEEKFYKKNKKFILFFFVISILIISIINFDFQIYQRGIINDYGFFINTFFTFLFFIFFPALTVIIINYEVHTNKSIRVSFLVSIFESFVNSYSILSRNFIFNPLSNIFGLYKLNNINKKFNNNYLYFFMIIIIIFFLISVILVSKERNEFETKVIDQDQTELTLNNINKNESNLILDSSVRVFKIFISRLIGIEGVMAVSSGDQLGFKLFFSALKEKFVRGENSFYDKFKNENRTNKDCVKKNYSKDNCKINSISLMGIVAFLYYSGSYIFLYLCLLIICLFCSFIEVISYKASNNMIFSALVSQILAYRLWHFGYIPSNSYKLLLSICFIIFLIYLYRKLISKIQI